MCCCGCWLLARPPLPGTARTRSPGGGWFYRGFGLLAVEFESGNHRKHGIIVRIVHIRDFNVGPDFVWEIHKIDRGQVCNYWLFGEAKPSFERIIGELYL